MNESDTHLPLATIADGTIHDLPTFEAASLHDPAVRALLCEVDVLLARNTATGRATPLFGSDRLWALTDRPPGSPPADCRAAAIRYAPVGGELELLIAATLACKGSCDLYTPKKEMYQDTHATVFGPATGARRTVPVDRGGAGTARSRDTDAGTIVWVSPDQIIPGPIVQPPFSPAVKERLRKIWEGVRDVYPITLARWEEGFRRDVDPDGEIALWEHMERCLRRFTDRASTRRRRKAVFTVILRTTLNGPEHTIATAKTHALPKKRVREIVAYVCQTFRLGGRSGRAGQTPGLASSPE